MSSRASRRRAGQTTRKRVRSLLRPETMQCGGGGGAGSRGRFPTPILGPLTLRNHILSQMPTPRPQQPPESYPRWTMPRVWG